MNIMKSLRPNGLLTYVIYGIGVAVCFSMHNVLKAKANLIQSIPAHTCNVCFHRVLLTILYVSYRSDDGNKKWQNILLINLFVCDVYGALYLICFSRIKFL
eukprot:230188_1